MAEYEVIWQPPGYRPVPENALAMLCNGDAEPALLAMREQALIVRVDEHDWDSLT